MSRAYPLLLEPILLEKVWGGTRLRGLGKALPEGQLIGESWELADLACTSPTGAGGAAICSRIINGPLAGRTLRDAVEQWGADLLGGARLSADGGFPVLVKFLDARENLSIQVHPSPAYAAAHADCHIKSECWYIIAAEPDGIIYKGLRAGVTREQLAADVHSGRIVEDLIAVPAIAGECHLLPSGTCHALGRGVLVAEIQTPSDTTFRLHDWGRPRPVHIAEALECILLGPAPPATRRTTSGWACLAVTEGFVVYEGTAEDSAPPGTAGARVVIVLEGDIEVAGILGCAGQTLLIPAACSEPLTGSGRCLLAAVK